MSKNTKWVELTVTAYKKVAVEVEIEDGMTDDDIKSKADEIVFDFPPSGYENRGMQPLRNPRRGAIGQALPISRH